MINSRVEKSAITSPKTIKILNVIRAPKKTIAQDAPSKKLMILEYTSFCIGEF